MISYFNIVLSVLGFLGIGVVILAILTGRFISRHAKALGDKL